VEPAGRRNGLFMGKSDTSFLLPLLALVAVVLPFSINFRSQTPPAGQQVRATPESGAPGAANLPATELAQHSAAKLVANYLDLQPGMGEWPDNDPRRQYALDFIVATIPDPVDSRLPYFFDSFLDSIQRACEAAGYVLDSFDLAWPLQRSEGKNIASAHRPVRFESEPSLLLFRDPRQHKLLVIFLVGETPTGGIHKHAMASALRQIASFYPWGPGYDKLPRALPGVSPDSRDVIKLMVPSFSGSAASLEFSLRDWLDEVAKPAAATPLRLEIVSGTATAIDRGDFIAIGGGARTSFRAVVPPDIDVMKALEAYLKKLGVKKIALLSEANTAYGRNLSLPDVLTLPFPLHISELRTASAKQQQAAKQQATSELPLNAPSSLPLPEGSSSAATETPPVYSPLEVSSAELVLSRLLSTISRESIHAVGILATDVQDTIFLAQEIRAHCPSTVIFTLSSDLIFTHPTASPSTEGMLVVTPYPLFNLNQLWSAPFAVDESRLQFSNQASEGVYNAILALLNKQDKILEYGEPFTGKRNRAILHPTLWVTSISRDGPLPVTLLPWDDPSHYSFPLSSRKGGTQQRGRAGRPRARGVYTVGSDFGVAVAGLLLIVFSFLVIRQYLPGELLKPPDNANWFAHLLADPVTSRYHCPSRLYLLTACVSLLSFYALMAAGFVMPRLATYRLGITLDLSRWNQVDLWILVGGLVAMVSTLVLLFQVFWKCSGESATLSNEVKYLVLGGSAAGLAATLYLVRFWFDKAWSGSLESSTAIFTYLRAFDVASGLSPLAPLFCVATAAFLWALCSLRRLRVIDGIDPAPLGAAEPRPATFLEMSTASFEGVTELEGEVRALMESSSVMSTGWYLGFLGVALAAGCYYFFFRLVRSFEGTAFYILFGLSFFLVYWALAMEFVRLWLLWHSLWRLLRRLSWHPMRAAFSGYRKSFPGLGKINSASPPPPLAVLAFSVDQAERLVRSAGSLSAPASAHGNRNREFAQWALAGKPHVRRAAQSLSDALVADAEGDWRLAITKRSESQGALARLTPSLTQLLEVDWRLDGTESSSRETTPATATVVQLGEEFLAGRVVHLISFVLPALRNLGAFVLTGLLLMLAAVVGAAVVILVQMERDVVLSALSDTAPGQITVTRQFVFNVLTYVLLPIVALLGAQYPETVGRITSLLGAVQGHP
jgi:hypothetical protein